MLPMKKQRTRRSEDKCNAHCRVLAANTIQRMFKSHLRMHPINSKDPISLEHITPEMHAFKLVSPNGLVTQYDAANLGSFLLATGSWKEPLTNASMTIVEIRRLQNFLATNLHQRVDLVSAFQNPLHQADEKFRTQALSDLDDMCAQLIVDALDMVDDPNCTALECIEMNRGLTFAQFDDYYQQMQSHDLDFALQCILKYITMVKGDPRHPRNRRDRKWMHVMDYLFAKVIPHI